MLGPVTNTQKEDILKTIDFVMNESKSHNLEVIGTVGMDLWVDEIAKNTVVQCPFPYDVSEICHEIQNLLGNKKIVECILVDIEFKCEPYVIKSLMCSSNWIDNNYSSKPWKRSYHFALFIKPKENRCFT